MQIYLVGGAVRDKLLGLPVKEKDWVVVGATVAEMLRLGFKPVGKDFPVFLHPNTKEEYALARRERKVGRGYTGFEFDTSADVTLEDDLMRRDLTINAIAETAEGELIDPYHGQQDLKDKILRHVSPAFSEDPVRILRVGRFAARFANLGFKVAPITNDLMKQMVVSGEVNALVAERVWKELERALSEKNPEMFFEVLDNCSALSILFPVIENAGMQALKNASQKTSDTKIRFAALLHNIPDDKIKTLCERYRVPSDYRELALLASRHIKTYRQTNELSEKEILNLLQSVDAFRREERFKKFLFACELSSSKSFSEELIKYYQAARNVDAKALMSASYSGKELADQIYQKRLELIKAVKNNQ